MAYANVAFYKGVFLGSVIPDADLPKLLEDASLSVDILTFNRIARLSNTPMSVFQSRMVSLAVCEQAEHIYKNKDTMDQSILEYSIGDVSISFNPKINRTYSSKCKQYLESTGFTNKNLSGAWGGY